VCLPRDPSSAGANPAEDGGFLRAIKIRNMTSFGGGGGSWPHIVRFYGMLKIPAEYDRDTSLAKFKYISCQLPALLLGVSAAIREL
jgi:hypothetical protein